MELGNLMFGNNYNKELNCEVDRDFIRDFEDVLERLCLGFEGHPEFDVNDYVIDEDKSIFGIKGLVEVHPYKWDIDDEPDLIPNLRLPQHDVTINWYKYPFRDAYSNREISLSEWKKIMNEIIKGCEKCG